MILAEIVVDWQRAYNAGIMPSPPPKEMVTAAVEELEASVKWSEAFKKGNLVQVGDGDFRWPLVIK